MSGPSIAPGPGPYDAVVFDLLTAVIDSWDRLEQSRRQ